MLLLGKLTSFEFEEIYISYFFRLKQFALEYVLSEEDAENIVQDVFTALWERNEMTNINSNLIPFLFVAIKNRSINLLRHRAVMQKTANKIQEEYQLTLQVKLASLEMFDDSLFDEEDVEQIVTSVINSLPDRCREIFIKSKIEGKKQKEIAEEMNISIKTVEAQMSIAYKKIKTELKDYFPLLLFLLGS